LLRDWQSARLLKKKRKAKKHPTKTRHVPVVSKLRRSLKLPAVEEVVV
jgi:hypothetical protein